MSSTMTPLPLKVGDKIGLHPQANPWIVQAVSEHFAACTITARDAGYDAEDVDPDQVAYTVLDWRNGVRGPCNLIGQAYGDGAYDEAECAEMLAEFEAGELEVSHRNRMPLKVRATSSGGE